MARRVYVVDDQPSGDDGVAAILLLLIAIPIGVVIGTVWGIRKVCRNVKDARNRFWAVMGISFPGSMFFAWLAWWGSAMLWHPANRVPCWEQAYGACHRLPAYHPDYRLVSTGALLIAIALSAIFGNCARKAWYTTPARQPQPIPQPVAPEPPPQPITCGYCRHQLHRGGSTCQNCGAPNPVSELSRPRYMGSFKKPYEPPAKGGSSNG